MNKETRTFILGLILLFMCGYRSAQLMHSLLHGGFDYGWDWVFLIFTFLGTLIGAGKIHKTTY